MGKPNLPELDLSIYTCSCRSSCVSRYEVEIDCCYEQSGSYSVNIGEVILMEHFCEDDLNNITFDQWIGVDTYSESENCKMEYYKKENVKCLKKIENGDTIVECDTNELTAPNPPTQQEYEAYCNCPEYCEEIECKIAQGGGELSSSLFDYPIWTPNSGGGGITVVDNNDYPNTWSTWPPNLYDCSCCEDIPEIINFRNIGAYMTVGYIEGYYTIEGEGYYDFTINIFRPLTILSLKHDRYALCSSSFSFRRSGYICGSETIEHLSYIGGGISQRRIGRHTGGNVTDFTSQLYPCGHNATCVGGYFEVHYY